MADRGIASSSEEHGSLCAASVGTVPSTGGTSIVTTRPSSPPSSTLRSRRERDGRRPSDVVFADCAGVRIVRGALSSLASSGVPLEILTGDPVARVSSELRRVA